MHRRAPSDPSECSIDLAAALRDQPHRRRRALNASETRRALPPHLNGQAPPVMRPEELSKPSGACEYPENRPLATVIPQHMQERWGLSKVCVITLVMARPAAITAQITRERSADGSGLRIRLSSKISCGLAHNSYPAAGTHAVKRDKRMGGVG